ncbi:glycosyltransferase family 4 protein [bacterium]|nr:glycosyltransferase family 4 protein [bacterium]MBU3930502.1 glycosyltransferase family 4 protein [bacterium]
MKVYVLGIRGFPKVQGGVEKHCEELFPRLVQLGCDITVFTRTPYIPEGERLKEWQGIKFIHLWCPRKKSFEAISHTFISSIVCIIKKPDIVHFHNIGPAIFVPLLKLFGIKTILTYHSINYQHQKWGGFAKFVLKAGEYLGLRFSNKVIVISKTTKKFLEEKYAKKDLEFMPNGVNIEKVITAGNTLKRYNLKPNGYIFTACRFVPEKGLHDLIEAYKRIKNPGFKLVIAGDADHGSDYSRKLKRLAKETDCVVMVGFVSGRPLAELFSNAGLFVLPSYYEGLPIALLEALSYGLPVLASDIPQNREVPLPDFRFFEVGNVDDLSKKMTELLNLGISAEEKNKQREILKENYNWDEIAQKTLEVYKSVLVKS